MRGVSALVTVLGVPDTERDVGTPRKNYGKRTCTKVHGLDLSLDPGGHPGTSPL